MFDSQMLALSGGGIVEDVTQLVQEANEQLKKSQEDLEKLVNQVRGLTDIVAPQLAQHIKELREARMSMLAETRQMLEALHDVRKFFLESSYESEMNRLQQFIAVCKELRALKQDGTLDAVLDSAIRLALKEKSE
jgi:hypothetical protein